MQKIRPSRSQLSEVGESGGFGIRDAERRCQAGPHRPQKDGKKRTEQIVALTRGDLQGELDRLFLILSLGGNPSAFTGCTPYQKSPYMLKSLHLQCHDVQPSQAMLTLLFCLRDCSRAPATLQAEILALRRPSRSPWSAAGSVRLRRGEPFSSGQLCQRTTGPHGSFFSAAINLVVTLFREPSSSSTFSPLPAYVFKNSGCRRSSCNSSNASTT